MWKVEDLAFGKQSVLFEFLLFLLKKAWKVAKRKTGVFLMHAIQACLSPMPGPCLSPSCLPSLSCVLSSLKILPCFLGLRCSPLMTNMPNHQAPSAHATSVCHFEDPSSILCSPWTVRPQSGACLWWGLFGRAWSIYWISKNFTLTHRRSWLYLFKRDSRARPNGVVVFSFAYMTERGVPVGSILCWCKPCNTFFPSSTGPGLHQAD